MQSEHPCPLPLTLAFARDLFSTLSGKGTAFSRAVCGPKKI